MMDYSNYGQNNLGVGEPSLISQYTGAAIAVIIVIAIIAIAVAIFMIVAQCKLYSKAGEKWWSAIIPVWNTWVETRITGLKWWWFAIVSGLAALSVFVSKESSYILVWGTLLCTFNYNYNLAKKFGKSNGFAFLCTILPIIGFPILAFGSAKYNKNAEVNGNGIFDVNW